MSEGRVKERGGGEWERKIVKTLNAQWIDESLVLLGPLPTTKLSRGWVLTLTFDIFCVCCHIETERGDLDSCLRWSYYIDTDSTNALENGMFRMGIKPVNS